MKKLVILIGVLAVCAVSFAGNFYYDHGYQRTNQQYQYQNQHR